MKINIISVGKLKEEYLKDGIKEYSKRLSKYVNLTFTELTDEPIKDKSNDKLDLEIKKLEGKRILQALSTNSYVIVLDLKGNELTSVALSEKISEIMTYNNSSITFIIGGSLGLSDEVISKADYRLCFSKMTFPHQLMKLVLLEQIYRSFKIMNNETYHK